MKKRNFIIFVTILIAIIICLVVILVLKKDKTPTSKDSEELRIAKETFDIRLNQTSDEYYIYGLKNKAKTSNVLNIPNSIDNIPVTKIIDRELSFSDYEKIQIINLGTNINYIGTTLITNDNTSYGKDIFLSALALTAINVPNENSTYHSIDGVLYDKDATILLKYPPSKVATNAAKDHFIIPSTVEVIGENAFHLCKYLDTITFGEKIKKVEANAFSFAESLTHIEFNEGLLEIGFCAFEHCNNLDTINLPNNLTTLDRRVFINCQKLVNVYLPSSLTIIKDNCFTGCNSLQHLYAESLQVDFFKNLFTTLKEEKIANLVVAQNNAN